MVQLSVTVFVVLLKNENCEFTVSKRAGYIGILRNKFTRFKGSYQYGTNEEGIAREDYTSRDP